jgi:hypothetical protein
MNFYDDIFEIWEVYKTGKRQGISTGVIFQLVESDAQPLASTPCQTCAFHTGFLTQLYA